MARHWLNRRQFLAGISALTGYGSMPAPSPAAGGLPVSINVQPDRILGTTPADFLGFGYEISSVALPEKLSAGNRALLPFFRTLGPKGVIRIGGNTSDYSIWSPNGQAAALPKATVTNRASIRTLGTFLHATGWDLIWGLNLGHGTPELGADQGAEVAAAAGAHLRGIEIGNEPDLFARIGHRPPGYGYPEFHADFQRFSAALRRRVPGVPLAGPDIAISPDWVTFLARDEGANLKLLTAHYYATGPPENPAATVENLLKTDEGFMRMLGQLRGASKSSGVPYRMVELNSCFGGGKPGLSDTFASALWGLDLMFALALSGGSGINWETGQNHLGKISSYSPIGDDERGNYSARPLYYALLAFARAGIGRRVEVSCNASEINLKSYGVLDSAGHVWLTVINKDLARSADITVRSQREFSSGQLFTLTAPAIDSKTEVTLAGAGVSAQGQWDSPRPEHVRVVRGVFDLRIAARTAALVRLV
jgi:hypothetical protein